MSIVGPVLELDHFPVKVEPGIVGRDSLSIELTKAELRSKDKLSAVARTALYQWNKLNTTVRRQVCNILSLVTCYVPSRDMYLRWIIHTNYIHCYLFVACVVSWDWWFK